jgi:flagellar hook assembly protein FlgD
MPEGYSLSAAPNPFNNQVTIYYDLVKSSEIEIIVYNLLGQKVDILMKGNQFSGQHKISWNGQDHYGNDLANGVYFVRLNVDGKNKIHKLALLR